MFNDKTSAGMAWLAMLSAAFATQIGSAEPINFSRDVRPILAENCFACHGFDDSSREADLRLDSRESAIADRDGTSAIVPGKPEASLLIARVTSTDPDLAMPPADSHKKPLTPEAIAILRSWITQGAPWGKHWAFEKPHKTPVPEKEPDRAPNPIDFFIGRKLTEMNIDWSPPAKTHQLARRLSFDLTGLPPRVEVLELLGDAPSAEQWARYVDQLLQSSQYGERMAMWWLDASRYSDTDGFQADAIRNNWPWRDWVAESFRQNKRFDEFTIEQFAGDLLPNPTPEQQLATCFNRNHMTNGEGGRDPEESRIDYVRDRVNTMGTVFLGLTLECAQCHSHKFDPLSHTDYYSLTSYFNSIDEDGRAGGGAKPFLSYESPHAANAVNEETHLLSDSQKQLDEFESAAKPEFEVWFKSQRRIAQNRSSQWKPLTPAALRTVEGSQLTSVEENIVQASGATVQDDYVFSVDSIPLSRMTGIRLEVFPHASHTTGGLAESEDGEFILTNLKLRIRSAGSTQFTDVPLAKAVSDFDGKGKDAKYAGVSGTLDDDPRTGWTTRGKPNTEPHVAVFALAKPLVLGTGQTLEIILMHRSLFVRSNIGRFRLSVSDQGGDAVRSVGKSPLAALHQHYAQNPDGQNPDELANQKPAVAAKLRERFLSQYLSDNEQWNFLQERHGKIRKQLDAAKSNAGKRNVMILSERGEPRASHVLVRGVWDKHGETVSRRVPDFVLPRAAEESATRLDLAKWLVDRDNPLTARVITNHVWQLLFGHGLVRTPGDFGQQGEAPSHPELLDWLAVDFMESGWDLHHLIRTIVSSRTYQQNSAVSASLIEIDPENRLLARGARYRLPSWMIRDSLLSYSDLINPAFGGAPVFPHQPEGVWQDQFMGRFTYEPSIGPAQYRRTLYAFWRRTSGPTFLFDSSARRRCEVTPRRTNTPLQALTLLNDRTALEAARALADQMLAIRQASNDPASNDPASNDPASNAKQIALMADLLWRTVLSRSPEEAELAIFVKHFGTADDYYRAHPKHALQLLNVGQSVAAQGPLSKRAAAMVVANMILNLDETITHE
jgi:hypothetical protein